MFNVGLSSRILLSDDAFPCAKERHWEVPTSALFQPSGMFYRGGKLHLVAGAAATVRTFRHGEGKGRGSWSGLSAACFAGTRCIVLQRPFFLPHFVPVFSRVGREEFWSGAADSPCPLSNAPRPPVNRYGIRDLVYELRLFGGCSVSGSAWNFCLKWAARSP